MGVTTMILGESGRGKSRSIKNLNPEETLVIKSVKKPFPFPTKDWKNYDKPKLVVLFLLMIMKLSRE